jgi:hypothetical protein
MKTVNRERKPVSASLDFGFRLYRFVLYSA